MERNGNRTSHAVFDLAPGPGNPRNSEGAFCTLGDGMLRFYFSRYTGSSYNDSAVASIASVESRDGGQSWENLQTVFTPREHNAKNIMSVSCLTMDNGDLGIVYLIRYSWAEIRAWLRRSGDGGRTWSEPVCCVTHPGYHCTHNDRVIRLTGGRLLVPTSLAGLRSGELESVTAFREVQRCCFFYSDDDGATWKESRNFVSLHNRHSQNGIQEPGVIELSPGLVYAWGRTDLGRQYEMLSRDNGESWTAPEPSPFTGPCSPLSMKRIPEDGRLVAVWNPIPNYQTRETSDPAWGRTRLVYALSGDNGRSWGEPVILEDADRAAGFCYTAIHFTREAMLLAYCAGSRGDGICLARTRIRRIPLESL